MDAHLPVDHFNAELRSLGRSLDAAVSTTQTWRTDPWKRDEFGLVIEWADGFSAFVGFGPVASAIVRGWGAPRH